MIRTLTIAAMLLSIASTVALAGPAYAELQALRAQAGQEVQNRCLEKYPGDDQQEEVDRCIAEEVTNRTPDYRPAEKGEALICGIEQGSCRPYKEPRR